MGICEDGRGHGTGDGGEGVAQGSPAKRRRNLIDAV